VSEPLDEFDVTALAPINLEKIVFVATIVVPDTTPNNNAHPVTTIAFGSFFGDLLPCGAVVD
jgi:hypothetical protein